MPLLHKAVNRCTQPQPPRMFKFFLALALISTCLFVSAQNDSFSKQTILREDFEKTANWKESDQDRRFFYAKYPKDFNLTTALSVIKSERDFEKFLQAKTWCIDNFKVSIPHLLILLTDTTKVGLTGTADLIIWDRVQSGDLKFYGHGGNIPEDIFTIAGRCSYILNELTGENFLWVHMATTKKELELYRRLWKSWFGRL